MKAARIPTPLRPAADRGQITIHEHATQVRFRFLVFLRAAVGLVRTLLWSRVRGTLDDRELGRQLADFCQRMGVLWMKVGQLLSIRGELLPRAARDELARLQDRARGFAPALAVQAIEAALGAPLAEHFATFEETPFAAASISQVHRARLRREGVWVAVKVQRPEVARVFASDLALIRRIVGIARRIAAIDFVRWDDLLWELQHLIGEELDYRFEASNIRRMRKNLRAHGVYAPRVYRRYSTERVLTMEYVDGVFLSDYLDTMRSDPARVVAWCEENDVDPERVAKAIFRSHLRQSLEDNLFHSDLHPGNIVLLRNSRIAFIDFGSVGFAERDFLRRYTLYLEALAEGQYAKLVDLYCLFVVSLPPIDLSELKDLCIRALQKWEMRRRTPGLPFEQRSIGSLADELIRIAGENHVALDWTFLRIHRAWFTMDISFRELCPAGDMKKLTLQFMRRRERRAVESLAEAPVPTVAWLQTALAFPQKLYEQTIYRGGVVRQLAMVFEGTVSKVGRFFAALFGGLALGTLLTGGALTVVCLRQQGLEWMGPLSAPLTSFPALDYQVWVLILVALASLYRTFAGVRRTLQHAKARVPGI